LPAGPSDTHATRPRTGTTGRRRVIAVIGRTFDQLAPPQQNARPGSPPGIHRRPRASDDPESPGRSAHGSSLRRPPTDRDDGVRRPHPFCSRVDDEVHQPGGLARFGTSSEPFLSCDGAEPRRRPRRLRSRSARSCRLPVLLARQPGYLTQRRTTPSRFRGLTKPARAHGSGVAS
jgi:hypothetical protein